MHGVGATPSRCPASSSDMARESPIRFGKGQGASGVVGTRSRPTAHRKPGARRQAMDTLPCAESEARVEDHEGAARDTGLRHDHEIRQ